MAESSNEQAAFAIDFSGTAGAEAIENEIYTELQEGIYIQSAQPDQPAQNAQSALQDNPFCDPEPFTGFMDTLPPATRPALPLPQWRRWLDVGILAVLLLAAGCLVFYRKARPWTIMIMLVSLLVLGFMRFGCVCPVGATGNIVVALSHINTVSLSIFAVLFFVLPLVCALVFGRVFCGSVCPFGVIQDVLARKTFHVPRLPDRILGLGKYAVLGIIIYAAVVAGGLPLCKYDPFIAILRLTGSNLQWLLAAGILVVSVLIARPFCRWLCPYAVLLHWLSRIAVFRRYINTETCILCGKCQKVCPNNSITVPAVNNGSCVACNRCSAVCPVDAVKVGVPPLRKGIIEGVTGT
jgi:NAD-dependent dihydropyrimidine dehydrogenase PreA subunit